MRDNKGVIGESTIARTCTMWCESLAHARSLVVTKIARCHIRSLFVTKIRIQVAGCHSLDLIECFFFFGPF